MSDKKYTTEQYKALKDAYVSGVMQVSYAGQSTTYRSLQEMKQLLNEMEAELGISKPRGVLQRHAMGIYSKGL